MERQSLIPRILVFAGLGLAAAPALAQSSVTLYGVVDDSIIYQSSQSTLGSTSGGRSNIKMVSGIWWGDRWGIKGAEDLGGGTKVNFQLESGFNIATGGQQFTNAMFGRQAWIGGSNPEYGSLTIGRQYTPYYTLVTAPYGPTLWLTGGIGAHPGDLDQMDLDYRANSSLVYVSPKFYGVTVGASYSLAGVPGSIYSGSTWSGALQYASGPLGIGAAFERINNSTSGGGVFGTDSTTTTGGQSGVSAVTNGYQGAQAQQRFAVAGLWTFNSSWDVSVSYSNVQYIPGINSKFSDTAVFNTEGAVLHYKALRDLDLAGGYSYTRASKANGITSAAQYQQVTLSQYYTLSKRTGLYALQAYQRANGNTLGTPSFGTATATPQINATAAMGDAFQSTPSSSRSMVAVVFGIIHHF
ncbi:porin [Caballeronia mineralivorans PML1(12)]|uniref:Porin n=1 Tax=Caballeronia mineralivorans PML1(12) TaxID=908627 RepID=A0A0J1CXH6_9BURK|nr:porin [Caballeronia mineralivorans PML1(12)]